MIEIQDIRQVKTSHSKQVVQKIKADKSTAESKDEKLNESVIEMDCQDDWFYLLKEMSAKSLPFLSNL